MANEVDISENDLLRTHPVVLEKLLLDHTTHKNIFWATDSYASLGKGFSFSDEITIAHITGENGRMIQPRAVKLSLIHIYVAITLKDWSQFELLKEHLLKNHFIKGEPKQRFYYCRLYTSRCV